jgi:hypothetical protein
MSDRRIRNKGRSSKEGRHVRLYHQMMKTEAWRDLDCTARCAYIELASRYGGPGTNNGRIPYSTRELGEALGVSKATAWRALQALQSHGFIVEIKPGAFSYKLRHATEWRLTEFGCDVTGVFSTRNYQCWQKNTVSPTEPDGSAHETE